VTPRRLASGQLALLRAESRGVRYDVVRERLATPKPASDPVRIRRLRRDAKRPMSTNLAEGIALSHALLRFTGVARGK
jgi:hypothetical protein